MRRRPAVSINDDLPPGQATISIGAANHEFTGWINMPGGIRRDPSLRESFPDIGLHNIPDLLRAQRFVEVLRRQNDLSDADGLSVHIFDSHVGLGVWTELSSLARIRLAGKGEFFEDFVGVVYWRWHELRRFATGVAEHDALIARPFILIAARIDALGNFR